MAARQAPARAPAKAQRGGFAVGLIVGLLAGLAVALVVALWVTKAPIPFVNKLPQRGAEQDAAEAERNKNWDPNAPLAGKSQARPATPSDAAASAPAGPATPPAAVATSPAAPPASPAPQPVARDPAAILAGQAEPAARPAARSGVVSPPAPATAPAARLPVPAQVGMAPALNPAAAGPALQFYVQAGAYSRPDDADAQRARVAMLGMAARVMAREQAGRTVYRVRVGPFDDRSSAEDSQSRLAASGIEASLVRVER